MQSSAYTRLFSCRCGGIILFYLAFILISQLVRLALFIKTSSDISWNNTLLAVFGWGILFDFAAASLFSIPVVIIHSLLPNSSMNRRVPRLLYRISVFGVLFLLLFSATAEWLFWDEFSARFNFIAVDYLIYTTEVVGNIRESYPVPLLLGIIAITSFFLEQGLYKMGLPRRFFVTAEPLRQRLQYAAILLLLPLVIGLSLNERLLPEFANNYHRELSKNGIWSIFAAFRNNELEYEHFYPTLPMDKAYADLQRELSRDGAQVVDPAAHDTLRIIKNEGEEIHANVIQITVESLSAHFLNVFTPGSSLTPNLDGLARKSLLFENFYATGTRTDRGMEALALSLPPTPGRSLIKRPNNEHLFTLGAVMREKGYDTAFIYGGYGYFDNMNYFFGNNGYRVVDRAAVKKEDVTFANAWGVCDEDLYNWTLREADNDYAAGKPFHFFIMTTSNHRPYTYPEGRIDLPPKISERRGAVKYTDYAIGRLLQEAAHRPWFNNTIFVIVADHCAASAGKTELPLDKYRIPLLIYAPGGQIAPGRVKALAGQIDLAPTLLGLMHWRYLSRFYGLDVLKIRKNEGRALVGNYQALGYLEQNIFTILKPVRNITTQLYEGKSNTLSPATVDASQVAKAISYYQTASDMYQRGVYRELDSEKQEKMQHVDKKE